MMKKLKETINKQKTEEKQAADPKKKSGKSSMAYYMPVVADRPESIDAKLKKLQGSFFGKPVNKVDVGTLRDVWVPYGYFVYDYEVGGKGLLKAKRSGQVHIICDLNEKHCMQYDEKESGDLPLERKDFAEDDWTIIKSEMSERKATEFVEEFIQMKVMYRTFGRRGTIKPVKSIIFLRPAVEMEIFFRGVNRNIRYAYLDSYGVKSEHILGLKYRLTH